MICKSAIEQGVSLIQTRCKYWSLRMLKRIGTGAGKNSLTRGSRVWTLDTHGWKSPDTRIIYRHPPNCSVLAVESTRSVWKTHIHTSAASLQILSGFISSSHMFDGLKTSAWLMQWKPLSIGVLYTLFCWFNPTFLSAESLELSMVQHSSTQPFGAFCTHLFADIFCLVRSLVFYGSSPHVGWQKMP